MQKPRVNRSESTAVRILAVTPNEEDHAALDRMLSRPAWAVDRARSLSGAITKLRKRNSIPVVLCARDLSGNSWRDMLEQLERVDEPPLLIVISRCADEQLWAEALNLGAYDVLAKPFNADEVIRVLSSACLRWHKQNFGR